MGKCTFEIIWLKLRESFFNHFVRERSGNNFGIHEKLFLSAVIRRAQLVFRRSCISRERGEAYSKKAFFLNGNLLSRNRLERSIRASIAFRAKCRICYLCLTGRRKTKQD